MFKFLFSQLTHKDKVFAFAKKHRKTIEKLSAKSPYFSKTVKKVLHSCFFGEFFGLFGGDLYRSVFLQSFFSSIGELLLLYCSMWYTYILKCSDDTYYTGITTDITRRLRQHNGEIVGGAKYTRVRQPVALVYQAEFQNRSQASSEEYRIKQLSREQKKELLM